LPVERGQAPHGKKFLAIRGQQLLSACKKRKVRPPNRRQDALAGFAAIPAVPVDITQDRRHSEAKTARSETLPASSDVHIKRAPPMDLRKLKTLIDLVSDSNISELEITEAEGKVRIVKGPVAGVAAPAYAPPPSAAGAPSPAAMAPVAPVAPFATPEAAPEPEGKVIKSPMVGTFYRAASPGAKPFVEVGDQIRIGNPACIIEAMKIMNEIESDCDGKVLRILCENGQAVEFGQPLFIVE